MGNNSGAERAVREGHELAEKRAGGPESRVVATG